jgi:uncharacterized Zn-binding protein involved in type VI secretion
MHTCPMVTVIVPHVCGPISGPGAPTVLAENLPVAAVGDTCACTGPPDVIVEGAPNVLVAGRPLAALGSKTAHGGVVVAGAPTVVVGAASGGFLPPGAMSKREARPGQADAPSVSIVAAAAGPAGSASAVRERGVLETPTYTVVVDLEQIDSRYDDDEFTLASEGGEYRQTRTVKDDGEVVDGRWLEVTFSKVEPGKIYSCYHDLKKTASGKTAKLLLFKGVRLDRDVLAGVEGSNETARESGATGVRPLETEAGFDEPDEKGVYAFALAIRRGLGDDEDRSAGAAFDELDDSFWIGRERTKDEWILPSTLPDKVEQELAELDRAAEAALGEAKEKGEGSSSNGQASP